MLRCTLLSWVLADAVTPRLPCLASYTESRHLGFSGGVLWELGMHGQYIAETHNRLTSTITTRTEGRARTRSQIKLARLIMATGDPLEATALGTQALDWATSLRSNRRRTPAQSGSGALVE
jgi:hypothetical protein